MLTLGTRLKNLAFVIIGTITLFYIGTNYANLGRYVGLSGYYVVKVDLPQAGGLTTNADVTYRGISVGRVGPLELTSDGVLANLHIDNSAPKIPANTQAVVANRSAVGEQYIDLRPATRGGPYLAAGTVIPRSATQTPAPVTDLLASVDGMVSSVPLESLRVVVDELGRAFSGQGQNLGALLDNGADLTQAASRHVEPTNRLITDGAIALRTQNEEADALAAFGRNARLLSAQLRASDPDLRKVITAGTPAAEQFAGLLRDVDPSLSVMLANLLTTSDLLFTRYQGMEELLVKVPAAVAAGSTVVGGGKLNFGMVTTFFDPLPCTRGYGGTRYRNGLDTSRGPALNTAARCTMPASSGVNVRGAGNAPRGRALPPPARPGSVGMNASARSALPGALGLPALPAAGPSDMSGLLGLRGTG
ncbi:ABC transporter substrate-binding protein [Actinomadura craniellae]|uniref:ABC transporter substrate-binding protein n=1 Tax=Actinomadura craniellae TaxID=2231787 RepID=A0A365GW33_9ACTN|nr:MlaD family protein [Actinomadura craniellae]RAY11026.1 ABC transporter substrate-binding protein [Actinomadura craniellae]